MTARIGHASIDERGRASGGKAGDQTGREVCTRLWYNKPWLYVIRPKSANDAEKIAKAMEQACANDNIGYDQYQRTTLFALAKAKKWDISKVTTKCETDCSALVAVCVNAAGISVSKDMYTGNEKSVLQATGKFTIFNTSAYLSSSDYLKRGDILLGKGHTAIVLSDGDKVKKTTPATPDYEGKEIGTATALTDMNVRTSNSTNSTIISTIKKGTVVKVLEKMSNGWYKIIWAKANSGYAYVSNSNNKYFNYIEKNKTTSYFKVKVTANALNVRKGPGTNYSIVSTIRDKGTYTIVKTQGKWGYLSGGTGWIHLDYTKRV